MAVTNPLFKFGVDIEKTDADGKTALHRAAMFSDQDKASQFHFPLLPATINSPGCTASQATSHALQVAWMLDEGLDIEARDATGATPLHCAVFYMQRPIIALLLSRGAAIDTRDAQARRHCCCRFGLNL